MLCSSNKNMGPSLKKLLATSVIEKAYPLHNQCVTLSEKQDNDFTQGKAVAYGCDQLLDCYRKHL
jgi:hypothetical protein